MIESNRHTSYIGTIVFGSDCYDILAVVPAYLVPVWILAHHILNRLIYRDDLSTYSAATTGISIPGPFPAEMLISISSAAVSHGQVSYDRTNKQESSACRNGSMRTAEASMTEILELSGNNPLPWIQILISDGGEVTFPLKGNNDRLQCPDQQNSTDSLACSPAAIISSARSTGFLGHEDTCAPTTVPCLAAILSLAAQCKDTELARLEVWKNPASLIHVIHMLQVRKPSLHN